MDERTADEKERQRLMAEAYRYLPDVPETTMIVLRVFTGGEDGMQSTPLTLAIQGLQKAGRIFRVEKLCIKIIKDNAMTPKDLVDWLLASHIHLVLSHIHQGFSGKNEHQLGWNMNELATEVQRLQYHRGFPNGTKLQCPVFTQDKYKYISAVPEFCNPTCKVSINEHYYEAQDYHSLALEKYDAHLILFFYCKLIALYLNAGL